MPAVPRLPRPKPPKPERVSSSSRDETILVGVEAAEHLVIPLPFLARDPAVAIGVHRTHAFTPTGKTRSLAREATAAAPPLSRLETVRSDFLFKCNVESCHRFGHIETRRAWTSLVGDSAIRPNHIHAIGKRGIRVRDAVVDLVQNRWQLNLQGRGAKFSNFLTFDVGLGLFD